LAEKKEGGRGRSRSRNGEGRGRSVFLKKGGGRQDVFQKKKENTFTHSVW